MQAKLWTLNAIAIELARDRRSLARDLEGLAPDETKQVGTRTLRYWRLARVVRHLYHIPAELLDPPQQRARRDKIQADLGELTLAERQRGLIPFDRVVDEVGSVIADARTKLLDLPGRVLQEAPHSVSGQVAEIVRRLVYETLDDLSTGVKNVPVMRPGNGHAQD